MSACNLVWSIFQRQQSKSLPDRSTFGNNLAAGNASTRAISRRDRTATPISCLIEGEEGKFDRGKRDHIQVLLRPSPAYPYFWLFCLLGLYWFQSLPRSLKSQRSDRMPANTHLLPPLLIPQNPDFSQPSPPSETSVFSSPLLLVLVAPGLHLFLASSANRFGQILHEDKHSEAFTALMAIFTPTKSSS